MTKTEAEALTDEVRRALARPWAPALRAFEEGAAEALGYASWEEYCREEFGVERAEAYRMVAAGRVERDLTVSNLDTTDLNGAQARVLAAARNLSQAEMLNLARRALSDGGWKRVSAARLTALADEILPARPARPRPHRQLELIMLAHRVNEAAQVLRDVLRPLGGRAEEVREDLARLRPREVRQFQEALALLRGDMQEIEAALPEAALSGAVKG